MNNTTRRYPRTLEEAFGPYHRAGIYEKPEPLHKADFIVMIAAVFAVIVLVFVLR